MRECRLARVTTQAVQQGDKSSPAHKQRALWPRPRKPAAELPDQHAVDKQVR